MRFEKLRILLLLWLCAWFGIILPGHERGVVQLPDFTGRGNSCCSSEKTIPQAPAAHSCCSPKSNENTPQSPAKPNPSKCAVCFTCFTLELPTAIFFVSFFERELDELPAPSVKTLCSLIVVGTADARGPPVLAA